MEVSFQIKFHPEMQFYSFHPGMKLTSKVNFSSRDDISSRLHVNALLISIYLFGNEVSYKRKKQSGKSMPYLENYRVKFCPIFCFVEGI